MWARSGTFSKPYLAITKDELKDYLSHFDGYDSDVDITSSEQFLILEYSTKLKHKELHLTMKLQTDSQSNQKEKKFEIKAHTNFIHIF